MTNMNMKLGIISISLILIMSFSVIPSYAKLYKNADGTYMTEKQYENKVLLCSEMQKRDKLDYDIDCADHVLTNQGLLDFTKWIITDKEEVLKIIKNNGGFQK